MNYNLQMEGSNVQPKVLISACLLGVRCRYDGKGNYAERLDELMAIAQLVPVCPEILGGLETPRVPCERIGEKVLNRDGEDRTEAFHRGAAEAHRIGEIFGAKYALLKQRSPSCGSVQVYDGTFSGKCIPGEGVTAQLLRAHGYRIFGEEQVGDLIEELKQIQA